MKAKELADKYNELLKTKDFGAMAKLAARCIANITETKYFKFYECEIGVCPKCFESDEKVEIGNYHWHVCHEHRYKWFRPQYYLPNGYDPNDMSDEELTKFNKFLKGYEDIEPLYFLEKVPVKKVPDDDPSF